MVLHGTGQTSIGLLMHELSVTFDRSMEVVPSWSHTGTQALRKNDKSPSCRDCGLMLEWVISACLLIDVMALCNCFPLQFAALLRVG